MRRDLPRLVYRCYWTVSKEERRGFAWFIVGRNMQIRVPHGPAAILLALMFARGPISTNALADVVWGDDASGGPDDGRRTIYLYVYRLRTALAEFGLTISSRKGVGFSLERVRP